MPPTTALAVTEHVPDSPSADMPLVVLVHGSLDRSASFARVLRRLSDLHTVAYDRRGYHRSRDAAPHPTALDGHIDDLLEIIDGRAAVVIGHSYGGTIAVGAALRSPGTSPIRSIAAYEPPMPWLGEWSKPPAAVQAMAAPISPAPVSAAPISPAPVSPEEAAGEAERFFRRMVGNSTWERLPEAGKAARRADGPALAAELADIRTGVAPFDPNSLTIPAIFARGELSDPHHRRVVEWLAEHVAGSQLVEIPGAAHGAHLTHPAAFADLARAALARSAEPAVNQP